MQHNLCNHKIHRLKICFYTHTCIHSTLCTTHCVVHTQCVINCLSSYRQHIQTIDFRHLSSNHKRRSTIVQLRLPLNSHYSNSFLIVYKQHHTRHWYYQCRLFTVSLVGTPMELLHSITISQYEL